MPPRLGGQSLLLLLLFFHGPRCDAVLRLRPPARVKRPLAATRMRLNGALFESPGLELAEAVRRLSYLPASCVVVDPVSNTTRFMLSSSDFYNKSASANASIEHGENGAHCKANGTSATYGMVVPTYVGHKHFFYKLVHSMKLHTPAVPVQLIGVFSSVLETQDILQGCPACWLPDTEDALRMKYSSNISKIELRTLIFNYDYSRFHAFKKFNYQTAKKLWALSVMETDYAIMFDSDFELTQSINMEFVVQKYEHVLYQTRSWTALDLRILENTNRFLGTSFDFFPMELPWMYKRSKVRELIAFLSNFTPRHAQERHTLWKENWVEGLLQKNAQLFEIVLYNLFVLKTDPSYFSTQIDTRPSAGGTFVFEKGLTDDERMALPVAPPGTTCQNQRGGSPAACGPRQPASSSG